MKLGVSRRSRATTAKKSTKKRDHMQSCCFANPNLLLFCHSRYRCLSSLLTNIRQIQVSFIQSQSVKETHYLSHAQSSLMHVAEVKHGLCVVLLFRCQSVVICSCLVINLGSVTIIMIITHFHSSCCVTCGKNKQKIDTKEHLNLCNYCTCLRSLEKVSQALD